MKRTNTVTITYDVEFQDFMVDVVKTDYGYEAYLYKSTYGVRDLMFGLQEDDLEKFIDIVEANLVEYMHMYNEEYGD